jgi:hypothetical protein
MKQFKNNRWIGLTLLLALFVGKFFQFRQSVVNYKVDPETGEYPVPINYEENVAIINKHIDDC